MLPFIDQDEYQKHILSPKCKKVRNRITTSKNIIFVVSMGILIISLLFLISAQTAYIGLNIQYNADIAPFSVPVLNTTSYSYDNMTIDPNGYTTIDTSWEIESIQLFASSYSPMITKIQSMQYVIYGVSNPLIERPINTLSMYFYDSKSEIAIIGGGFYNLDYLNIQHSVSSEYVLSYIKINIIPQQQSSINNYSVSFYYFFQGDKLTSTNMGMVTSITINNLNFNSTDYNLWYNWKYNNGAIPSTYPFTINVTLNDFLYVKDPFNQQLYYFEWSQGI